MWNNIAPEFHRGELGPKVDVFALGVVNVAITHYYILEVYSEKKAYDDHREVPCLVHVYI